MSIDSISGLNLTLGELDEAAKRLCFFAPSGSGSYVRELHEFLALQAMSMLPAGQQSARQIFSKVTETVGQRFEFEEIFDALRRLTASDKIRCTAKRSDDPTATFLLPIETRNDMRSQVKAEEELERRVIGGWKTKLQRKYPKFSSTQIDSLEEALKLFTFRLLSQHSLETLQLFYGEEESLAKLVERLSSEGLKDIWQWEDFEFHLVRRQEVLAFFQDTDGDRKQYIASLLNSLFVLHLTQLDPKCAAIAGNQIPGGTLYLDTNFVFRLVGLQGPDLYIASQKLARISIDFGYKLLITPKTKLEYEYSLRNALNELRGKNVVLTSDLAALALEATSDEDFITGYWRKLKERGAYLDPLEYYNYYQHIEALLADWEVEVDNDTETSQIPDQEIATEASHLRSVMQDKFGFEAGDRVHQSVLEHDAYHRLLILRKRSELGIESFVNVKTWFLTCDSKLPPYDRIRRSGNKDKLPFCVLSGQWLQTLRPFLGHENGAMDIAQVDMLVSPLLRAYQKPPSRLINAIASRLAMSTSYTSPRAVSAMFSNYQFLEQFEAAKDEVAEIDLIENFYAEYAEITERELRETQTNLEQIRSEKEHVEASLEVKNSELDTANRLIEETSRSLEREKIGKEEFSERLKQKSAEAEEERRLREESEKTREEEKLETASRVRREKTRADISNLLLIVAVWVIYLLARHPDPFELVTSGLVTGYLGFVVVVIWKNSKLRWYFAIAPIAFGISILLSTASTPLLNLLSIFGIIMGVVSWIVDRKSGE